MNINITITASPEFLQVLQTLAASFTKPVATNGNLNGKALNGAPKKTAAPATTETTSTEEIETGSTATQTETITLEAIRAKVQEKATAGKRKELKSLLETYGVEKIPQLKKDQYTEFFANLNEL